MIIIRLTQATWRARELDKVRSILRHRLDRTGIEQDKLANLLKDYLGAEYTPAELLWFRDQLVSEGVIEVDEQTYNISTFAPKKAKRKRGRIRFPWSKKK